MAIANIDAKEMSDGHGNRVRWWIDSVRIDKPKISAANRKSDVGVMMPTECRERGVSYEGAMTCTLKYAINGQEFRIENKDMGMAPIMVKSNKCHLQGMSPAQLVASGEEAEELGGYFIINGNEKLIRLLIVNRRNNPMAIIRPSF